MKFFPLLLAPVACVMIAGCMSQETAVRQMSHEFVAEFPNHSRSVIYGGVVKWIAQFPKTAVTLDEILNREAGSIVANGAMEITPREPLVNMKMGFTMTVDVKDEKVRIRFANLRRLYGSAKYEVSGQDDFFRSSIALPYQHEARARFTILVQELTEFISRQPGDVATK